jgi:hypothetical protein
MKRSTIAGGSRRGSGSGFHWCKKPEEETDLRCTKAPKERFAEQLSIKVRIEYG